MKPSWIERNTYEKAVFVFQCLVAVALVVYMVYALLLHKELTDWFYPVIAIESALEASVQLKHSHKTAIINLLVSVSSIAVFLQAML